MFFLLSLYSSVMRLLFYHFMFILQLMSFFQSIMILALSFFTTRRLSNCLFLAMFNALSSVLLSGAAQWGCQEGLLYCSVSQGWSCFMTFQSESMIEVSIFFRRELSTGPELRKWVAGSFGGIGLSIHGWKAISAWIYSLKLILIYM